MPAEAPPHQALPTEPTRLGGSELLGPVGLGGAGGGTPLGPTRSGWAQGAGMPLGVWLWPCWAVASLGSSRSPDPTPSHTVASSPTHQHYPPPPTSSELRTLQPHSPGP